MSTTNMHRILIVEQLIHTLERDTWAYAYWRGVLESLQMLQPLAPDVGYYYTPQKDTQ